MGESAARTVVVSAVNIRRGGTLGILRECLEELSRRPGVQVTAIVHDASLCRCPGGRHIEIPWSTRSWLHRLWCEYISLNRISKQLGQTDLWLSLHDITPRVHTRRQAVYCQTSFPFLKLRARDFRLSPKIALFALLTPAVYRFRIGKNSAVIVQQEWFREALAKKTGFDSNRIIVARPRGTAFSAAALPPSTPPLFFYPAIADGHKNAEVLCEAAALLERRLGAGKFRVVLTIRGDENRYARWLRKRWGNVQSIEFQGYMDADKLQRTYDGAACLVHPSRVETWGMAISEFKPSGKPLILSDLPYARESAQGAGCVGFFPPDDAGALASLMLQGIRGGTEGFASVPETSPRQPYAPDWQALIDKLLYESTPDR